MRLSMPGLRSLWQALRGLSEYKVLTRLLELDVSRASKASEPSDYPTG